MVQTSKSLFNVIITGPQIAEEGLRLLSETCRVEFAKPYMKSAELADMVRDQKTDGLIVRMGKITEEVIQASPNLKVITKHGTGVDNIDIGAATKAGIPILIASEANFNSVAEHVLGLMFALAKDIPQLDARVKAGHWDKADYQGVELSKKVLGLIGFGRIGRRVSELIAPLGMEVLVYDPFLNLKTFPADLTQVQELDILLEKADIVSLQCPLTEQTRRLMGAAQFTKMKKTAWLINTARGEVVDEEALITALKNGEIAAAGLDTFSKEPPEDLSRLCEAGKTVLSPHVGGITKESFERMGVDAARNILTILEGRKPDKGCVINPEVFERG